MSGNVVTAVLIGFDIVPFSAEPDCPHAEVGKRYCLNKVICIAVAASQ